MTQISTMSPMAFKQTVVPDRAARRIERKPIEYPVNDVPNLDFGMLLKMLALLFSGNGKTPRTQPKDRVSLTDVQTVLQQADRKKLTADAVISQRREVAEDAGQDGQVSRGELSDFIASQKAGSKLHKVATFLQKHFDTLLTPFSGGAPPTPEKEYNRRTLNFDSLKKTASLDGSVSSLSRKDISLKRQADADNFQIWALIP